MQLKEIIIVVNKWSTNLSPKKENDIAGKYILRNGAGEYWQRLYTLCM